MSAEHVKLYTYTFNIVDLETERHLMHVTIKADYWNEARRRLEQWTYSDECPHNGVWDGSPVEPVENQLQDVVLD